ncbi:hypothetical protein BE11_18780 [Sorangium cellulosum]|nr:hypothetical protein BE11_18780 [Sorangium cellulosum]
MKPSVRVIADWKTIDDGIPVEEHEPLWLLIEWPFGESDPSKFAVTTLGTKMSKKQIVRQYKERYRTEQAYEEMKGELGLDTRPPDRVGVPVAPDTRYASQRSRRSRAS